MIQKKVLGTGAKQRSIGLKEESCNRTSLSTLLSALLLAGLSSVRVISSCVISPSESVTIVGGRILFSCNARPNNQSQGSIEFIKLGSDGVSGTDIFRPPKYGVGDIIIVRQYLAEGYFLSHLDVLHTDVTIQINETQLKHGGRYFCSCVESTSKLGTANFTVLEKLSFGRSGDKPLSPGTLVDLNCSVSFNGPTLSAFIDLTIIDANGTQVSEAKSLSLISNVTGHHAIQYKVVVDPKEEQRFTCEAKVWNKSYTGAIPLHSLTSNFNLKPDHLHVTTSSHHQINVTTSSYHSLSPSSPAIGRTAFIAVGVTAIVLVVAVVIVGICIYKTWHKRSNENVLAHRVQPSIAATDQDSRYRDVRSSTQHPPQMMPSNSEDKKQQNNTGAVNDVVVFDNDIYEASSGINTADCDTTEQIYNQIL